MAQSFYAILVLFFTAGALLWNWQTGSVLGEMLAVSMAVPAGWAAYQLTDPWLTRV